MARAHAEEDGQLAMDEVVIEDEVVEHALIHRQDRKNAVGQLRKEYKSADEAAKVAIQRLELPEGRVVRVGRFRIERVEVPARSVSFDTDPSSRLKIGYIKDEPTSEDAEPRPLRAVE